MRIDALAGLNGYGTIDSVSNAIKGASEKINSNIPGMEDAGNNDKAATGASFDTLLKSAMDMINETNRYTNEAAEAEIAFAMGLSNNTHDLQNAQMKANISLQYTVAVRNAVMDAYKEIMQIQF